MKHSEWKQLLYAYQSCNYRFTVPPVTTSNWSENDWFKHIGYDVLRTAYFYGGTHSAFSGDKYHPESDDDSVFPCPTCDLNGYLYNCPTCRGTGEVFRSPLKSF